MSVEPDLELSSPLDFAPVTVVVVDDSATQRRFVRAALAPDSGLEVVGEARNGGEAVTLVEELRPTAVLMDLHLPGMNGIEAIEAIMARRPTPIVVYSSFVDGPDRANAATALAAGAIDVMAKPGPADSDRLQEYAEGLRARLRVAGRARVITHPRGRLGRPGVTLPTTVTQRGAPRRNPPGLLPPRVSNPSLLARLPQRPVDVLAIGASTGGPQALATVLSELPEHCDTAIVVVQHMADGFMEGLAVWLDEVCPLPVSLAAAGRRLSRGTVTLAPSGLNLVVHSELRVSTHEPPPGQHHVPGIDITLSSVAATSGAGAAGILLTGMGRDGALGLKRIRDRGGFTVGQDEATSVVYGMPAAAMALDAVDAQLPLPEIGAVLRHLVSADRRSRDLPAMDGVR